MWQSVTGLGLDFGFSSLTAWVWPGFSAIWASIFLKCVLQESLVKHLNKVKAPEQHWCISLYWFLINNARSCYYSTPLPEPSPCPPRAQLMETHNSHQIYAGRASLTKYSSLLLWISFVANYVILHGYSALLLTLKSILCFSANLTTEKTVHSKCTI